MTIYKALAQIEDQDESAALCTVIRSEGATPRHVGSKMVVYPDGKIDGTVGGGEMESRVIAQALEAMRDGNPRILSYSLADPERGDPGVCGGQLEIFVEPVQPKPTMVVVGAGHVGKAVAHLAHWLGYRVVVSDDRPEFCNPEAVPDADEFYAMPLQDLPENLKINPWTYIILTTRGVDVDVKGVPELLKTEAAYIGVIGSKRRWKTARDKMVADGVSHEQIDQVRSPIGLELNAETPEEIAVSIMAEIIMLRRGGDAKPMSD
jgi:xanthine dehydrogenase accessory factor